MADPVNMNSGSQGGNDNRKGNAGLKAVGFVAGGILLLLIGLGLGWYFFYRVQVNVTVQAPPAPPPPPASKPDPAAVRALEEALEKQKQSNKALEDQIAKLRDALQGNVCTITDPRGLGITPPAPGGTPSGPQSPATPGVAPGTKGTAVEPKPGTPPTGTAADLVPVLENATVLILAPTQQGGLSAGSGFFVTANTVVTNNHVVRGAVDGHVFLTSRKLGTVMDGAVVAGVGGGTPTPGSADFAVVRVSEAVPAHIRPLGLSVEPGALKDVVAAGYPDAVLRNDRNWIDLLKGDPSKAPELIVTKGSISAIQNRETGLPSMPHTANISGGNSGGPLIDMCGRVVGINTFVSRAEAGAGGLFALGATGISKFLRDNNVAFDWTEAPCAK
ncbi:MAG: trypsin-like peptidase domain-containing protein [Alphaproteobacteria bacterium]|nr:trypsin-like peptidase domain-containing protein [Alphaproteobacteria bacterium]